MVTIQQSVFIVTVPQIFAVVLYCSTCTHEEYKWQQFTQKLWFHSDARWLHLHHHHQWPTSPLKLKERASEINNEWERERGWMNETDIIIYQYMLYNNIETILTICLFDRDKQRHHETALLYRKYFKVCFLHSTAVLRSSFYFNPTSCLKDCSVLIISDIIKTVSGRCCSVHVTADPSRPT